MRARANAAAANGCRRSPNAAVAWAASMRRTAWNVQRPHSRTGAMLQSTCHGMRHVACCIDRRDRFVAQFAAATARDRASATPSKVKTTNLSTLSARVRTSGRLDSAVGCARHSSRHMNGYCIHTRIYSGHCLGPPLFVRTAAADSVSARRTLIVRRVGRHIRLPSNPAQAAVGLVNATPTSAPGLGCHAKYRNQSRRQAHRTAGCCRCAALRRVASEIDRGGVARLISHWIGSLRAEQVEGLSPVPVQMWQRCAPVPVQMLQEFARCA